MVFQGGLRKGVIDEIWIFPAYRRKKNPCYLSFFGKENMTSMFDVGEMLVCRCCRNYSRTVHSYKK